MDKQEQSIASLASLDLLTRSNHQVSRPSRSSLDLLVWGPRQINWELKDSRAALFKSTPPTNAILQTWVEWKNDQGNVQMPPPHPGFRAVSTVQLLQAPMVPQRPVKSSKGTNVGADNAVQVQAHMHASAIRDGECGQTHATRNPSPPQGQEARTTAPRRRARARKPPAVQSAPKPAHLNAVPAAQWSREAANPVQPAMPPRGGSRMHFGSEPPAAQRAPQRRGQGITPVWERARRATDARQPVESPGGDELSKLGQRSQRTAQRAGDYVHRRVTWPEQPSGIAIEAAQPARSQVRSFPANLPPPVPPALSAEPTKEDLDCADILLSMGRDEQQAVAALTNMAAKSYVWRPKMVDGTTVSCPYEDNGKAARRRVPPWNAPKKEDTASAASTRRSARKRAGPRRLENEMNKEAEKISGKRRRRSDASDASPFENH